MYLSRHSGRPRPVTSSQKRASGLFPAGHCRLATAASATWPGDPFTSLLSAGHAKLQQEPLPAGYLDYLRLKLRRVAKAAPPDVRKSTFFG